LYRPEGSVRMDVQFCIAAISPTPMIRSTTPMETFEDSGPQTMQTRISSLAVGVIPTADELSQTTLICMIYDHGSERSKWTR
jgi:hypothetical protein